MISVVQYKTSLINDLYDLSVHCNISIEELADDICEDCIEFYQQGRADFIAEHTQINAYGKPFILISSEEYEQLKEQSND